MLALASAISFCASLNARPGARLNEIVAAANCPWWLTLKGVRPGAKCANADKGTMVSCAVETAAPADALEWPLAASAFIARLRAESAAIVAAVLVVAVDAPTNRPAAELVCCVPVGLAPEVETQMSRNIDGSCQ